MFWLRRLVDFGTFMEGGGEEPKVVGEVSASGAECGRAESASSTPAMRPDFLFPNAPPYHQQSAFSKAELCAISPVS